MALNTPFLINHIVPLGDNFHLSNGDKIFLSFLVQILYDIQQKITIYRKITKTAIELNEKPVFHNLIGTFVQYFDEELLVFFYLYLYGTPCKMDGIDLGIIGKQFFVLFDSLIPNQNIVWQLNDLFCIIRMQRENSRIFYRNRLSEWNIIKSFVQRRCLRYFQ